MQDNSMKGILFYRLDIKENFTHIGYATEVEMRGHEEVSVPILYELYPKKGFQLREQRTGLNFFHRIPEDNYECIKEVFEAKLF